MIGRHVLLTALILVGGCRGEEELALEQSCQGCSIALTDVWESERRNPDVPLPVAAVPASDRMLVAGFLTHRLVEFGADGHTVRIVGGPGQGPGEFLGLSGLATLPNGFVVVAARDRISFLGPRYEFESSFPVPFPVMEQKFVLVSDSMLVFASSSSGEIFHVYSPSGEATASFGTASSTPSMVNLGAAAGPSFWAVPRAPADAERRSFRIERWNAASQQREMIVERNPPWFASWEPSDYDEADGPRTSPEPIAPAVSDVHEDESGLVWTITVVSDPNYAADPGRRSWSRFADSILEVIDPSSGELIAVRRFDEQLNGFTQTGELMIYDEDDAGFPMVRLARALLIRPGT